jgi:outer membrane protein assembly factor BamB
MHRRLRYSAAFLATAMASMVLVGSAGSAGAASRTAAPSDNWPMFGHDPLHSGISPDTDIGVSTAPSLTQRWSKHLGGSLGVQSSPAVDYNTALKRTLVYDVDHAGVVSAFNASTGKLAWRRSIGAVVYSSPAVYRNTVYFGDNNGQLEALNAATGAVQCTFTVPIVPPNTMPSHVFSSPVVGNIDGTGPTVFFGDTNLGQIGHLWAVTGVGNTAGGCKERWAYSTWHKNGKGDEQTGVWDEPALTQLSNGTWVVVFGSSNPDGSVYALNAATGSRLWRFQTLQTGPDEDVGAGPTISPPGVNGFPDGVVYVDGKDGIEYALNLLSGQKIWSFTLGVGSMHALTVSVGALTGNTLTLGYAGSVFSFNATTGAVIWQATPGGTVQASPAVCGAPGDQALFVGDVNGTEYGFSLANGAQIFSVSVPGMIEDSTAIADGTLYFASHGTLYAYAPAG